MLVWDIDASVESPDRDRDEADEVPRVQLHQERHARRDTVAALRPAFRHRPPRHSSSSCISPTSQGRNWREPLQRAAAKSEVQEIEQSISAAGGSSMICRTIPSTCWWSTISVSTRARSTRSSVRTGRGERVQRKEESTGGYVTDLDGNVRARTRLDVDGAGAYVATEMRNPDSGSLGGALPDRMRRTATSSKSPDSRKIPNVAYVLSNVGRDKTAVFEYDIRARKLGEVVFEHKFFDATSHAASATSTTSISARSRCSRFMGPRATMPTTLPPACGNSTGNCRRRLESPTCRSNSSIPATGLTATTPMRVGRSWALGSSSLDRNALVVVESSPTEPASILPAA